MQSDGTLLNGEEPRILHVLEATLGGTLRYLENLAEASAGIGARFGLAYATSRADHRLGPLLARLGDCGWQLYPVPMVRPISPAKDVQGLLALVSALRRFRPDLVHCHSSKAGALGRVAALLLRQRPILVYSPHAIMAATSRILLGIERLLGSLTDRVVAVTESERQQLVQLGIAPPGRIEVVTPTIDLQYFPPAEEWPAPAMPRDARAFRVIGVGRLTEQKRPLAFLQTLSVLRRRLPDATGVWVGDGELRENFLEERARLGLDRCVVLTGWVSDVRPYFAASDALLSTSAFESFGYMVAESLAMELPVVATRIGGTIDILGPAEQALFAEGDTEQAACLLHAFALAPELARTAGRAGRQRIATTFSAHHMAAQLRRVYGDLLKRPGSSAALVGRVKA